MLSGAAFGQLAHYIASEIAAPERPYQIGERPAVKKAMAMGPEFPGGTQVIHPSWMTVISASPSSSD
jgi:hypothetical protein